MDYKAKVGGEPIKPHLLCGGRMNQNEWLLLIEEIRGMRKKLWNANKAIKNVATRINTIENKLTEKYNTKKGI